jgi:predicted outer membrane repeat protein
LLLAVIACNVAFAGKIIYVDDDAAGADDGSSWADAYKYLQDALADAESSNKPVEIRVAQGTYNPDRNTSEPNGTSDRTATFQLINGVTLKGGYAGPVEPDPNARDIEKYETILSGDLTGNDIDIKDLTSLRNVPTWSENCYHVVTGNETDSTAVIDGFIITSGHADGAHYEPHSRGGGMHNDKGSPTIASCTFLKNAALYGGGLYNVNSHPSIAECCFDDNVAYQWGPGDLFYGGAGGGMYNHQSSPRVTNCVFSSNYNGGMHNRVNSNPVLNDCVFIRNLSHADGGGMNNNSSSPKLTNCEFQSNSAPEGGGMSNRSSYPSLTYCTFIENSVKGGIGGGMDNYRSSVNLANCSFINNTSAASGGAIRNSESNMTSTNCLFSGNSSAEASGGAIFAARSTHELITCTFTGNKAASKGGGIVGNLKSVYILKNCIFWANEAPEGHEMVLYGISSGSEPSSIEVSHSVVMGGAGDVYIKPNSSLEWNEGNIDQDPLFSNSGYWDPNGTSDNPDDDFWVNGDYHLKSQAGRFDPNSQSWMIDDVTSPCIDAGDPNSRISNEPFPNGGIINMGAYGGTAEASKSYFGGPVCQTIITGDINGDCKVDLTDFVLMANHWLEKSDI